MATTAVGSTTEASARYFVPAAKPANAPLIAAHRIRMEGLIHYPPAAPDCLLMLREDGRVIELVGEKTTQIRGLDWADGAWIVLEGEDFGVSADSCSGGYRVLVRTFTLARRV